MLKSPTVCLKEHVSSFVSSDSFLQSCMLKEKFQFFYNFGFYFKSSGCNEIKFTKLSVHQYRQKVVQLSDKKDPSNFEISKKLI